MSSMGREPGWTLRRRLQVIITLALLPVVLVSIFQGVARARLDMATVHERLLQSARTDAVGSLLILLHLLKRHAKCVPKGGLTHLHHHSAHANPRADVLVDRR